MMDRPLEGFTILDLSQLLPGPYATRLLADLGARVIKIEPPGGDPLRLVPPTDAQGKSLLYAAINHGKESVVLDLKQDADRKKLATLVGRADGLVESFRPGVTARLGADYETLKAIHPGLIYCSITGFGQDGSWSSRPGHDLNFVSLSGILATTGPRSGEAGIPGFPVGDVAGGSLVSVLGILAALLGRSRSGRGCHLDISMSEAVASLAVVPWVHCRALEESGRPGTLPLTGLLPSYRLYETSDGRSLAVAALEPKFWFPLCEALELTGHAGSAYGDDPEVHRDFEAVFATRTLEEWVKFLETVETCVSPVLTPIEAARSSLFQERGFSGRTESFAPGFPYCVDGQRPGGSGTTSGLGEDTQQVMDWAESGS